MLLAGIFVLAQNEANTGAFREEHQVSLSAASEMAIKDSVSTITFKTVGSLALQADVFLPRGEGLHPTVLWIHGSDLSP